MSFGPFYLLFKKNLIFFSKNWTPVAVEAPYGAGHSDFNKTFDYLHSSVSLSFTNTSFIGRTHPRPGWLGWGLPTNC